MLDGVLLQIAGKNLSFSIDTKLIKYVFFQSNKKFKTHAEIIKFAIFRSISILPSTCINYRYAVIATGCASCPKIKCERPGCGTYFCYHCKQYWHPNVTCDTARAERASSNMRSSVSYSHENSQQAKGISDQKFKSTS